MSNLNNLSMAASPWAPAVGLRERCGVAPTSTRQGSGLPFSGYPTVMSDAQVTAKTAGTHAISGVLTDDARVPDPRRLWR